MTEINVLFIDDDANRTRIYTDFFAQISEQLEQGFICKVTVCNTQKNAELALTQPQYHLVILDVLLGVGDTRWRMNEILSRIASSKCAIGYVSAGLGAANTVPILQEYMNQLRGNDLIGIFDFDTSFKNYVVFDNQTENEGNDKSIHSAVVDFWSLVFSKLDSLKIPIWGVNNDNELTFLHLTDTHFGLHADDTIANQANYVIKEFSSDYNLKPDFVLWTGDIANKGLPSEYEKAKNFYQSLIENTVIPNNTPTLITAGNHDFNWNLALAPHINFMFDASNNLNDIQLEKEINSKNQELIKLRIAPFEKFYTQITQHPLNVYDKEYEWRFEYIKQGVVFLEFSLETFNISPLEKIGYKTQPRTFPNDVWVSAMREFKREKEKVKSQQGFVIIVIIHGDNPSTENQEIFQRLTEELAKHPHALIIVGGHHHGGEVSIENPKYIKLVGPTLFKQETGKGLGQNFYTIRRNNENQDIEFTITGFTSNDQKDLKVHSRTTGSFVSKLYDGDRIWKK